MLVGLEASSLLRASRRMRFAVDSAAGLGLLDDVRVRPSRSLWNLRLVVARAIGSLVEEDVDLREMLEDVGRVGV